MADDPQRAKDSPTSHPPRNHSWMIAVGLLCVAASIVYGFREYGIRTRLQKDAMSTQEVLMKAQEVRKMYDDRMAIYKPVTEAAAKIAVLKAQGANAAQLQDAVAQFKTQAWGPATLDGGANFTSAVQLFSRGLDAWADADQLQQLSIDLAKVCRNEAEAIYVTDSDGETSKSLLWEMNEIVRVPESRQAAERWLSLVDGGMFAESWKSASDNFQATIPQDRWTRAIGAIRAPFGSEVSRKMTKADTEGDHLVLQFATTFSSRSDAVETVTMVSDKDGQWKVAAYAVK